ncbi:hypothetical protein [Algoriphagus kandeliae]|uniref:hypothetical protein n=1 Tax=Algoriphagus kandeliae TaxID=2562278 RepID=UPI001F222AA4|nr:hypothetical protein [Algoriphagus kandeliae]
MKKYILAILVFLGLQFFAQAQSSEREKGRGVYVELFGNGITYSFNYDQRFSNRFDGLGFKAGVSYFAIDGSSLTTLPLGLNYLLGKEGKYFEVGMGGTYLRGADKNNNFTVGDSRTVGDGFVGTMVFGYRREPVDGGFLFRASLTPVFTSEFFWPLSIGISFGYAF